MSLVDSAGAVSIRCRARRTAERSRAPRAICSPVSIRCRARRTAEPGPGPCRFRPRRGEVSIRCRASRTAEHEGIDLTDAQAFVSIRCRARRTAEHPSAAGGSGALVSIRCRARRTAEQQPSPHHHHRCGCRFYSLSCETYSGTLSFVAVVTAGCSGFYSLSCETYSGTRSVRVSRRPLCCFYSLSCETYSGTPGGCRGPCGAGFYSLSCETYREPLDRSRARHAIRFLFAVVRDVQRNLAHDVPRSEHCFYSLSCETYSGTLPSPAGR